MSERDWLKSKYPELDNPVLNAYTIVAWLEHLYSLDPNFVYALISNRIPVNRHIADDPDTAVVDRIPNTMETEPHYQVGFIGAINGLLAFADDCCKCDDRVAVIYSDEVDDCGRRLVDGFCVVPAQKD